MYAGTTTRRSWRCCDRPQRSAGGGPLAAKRRQPEPFACPVGTQPHSMPPAWFWQPSQAEPGERRLPSAACRAGPQRSASMHTYHHHTRIISLRTRNERAPARLGCVGHCGSLRRPCCPPLPTPAMAPEHGRCRMNPCCFLACKQPVLLCPCEQYEQTGGQKAPRLLSCFR